MTRRGFNLLELGADVGQLASVAYQLEAYAGELAIEPPAGLVERVTAAISREAAPVPPVQFLRALESGSLRAALEPLAQTIRLALGVGRPFPAAIRIQAICLLVALMLAFGAGGTVALAGLSALVDGLVPPPRPAPVLPVEADRSPTPTPAPTKEDSDATDPSPTIAPTPSDNAPDDPAPTPGTQTPSPSPRRSPVTEPTEPPTAEPDRPEPTETDEPDGDDDDGAEEGGGEPDGSGSGDEEGAGGEGSDSGSDTDLD
ncbi:MAG TPA: hypothetical protein VGQ47_03750 [Candidatus Limnocylindrales bacterium]|jgi:hypothetical protein|nr:hypothetical protein [Candidatus Limnocylindrales bacterium]